MAEDRFGTSTLQEQRQRYMSRPLVGLRRLGHGPLKMLREGIEWALEVMSPIPRSSTQFLPPQSKRSESNRV